MYLFILLCLPPSTHPAPSKKSTTKQRHVSTHLQVHNKHQLQFFADGSDPGGFVPPQSYMMSSCFFSPFSCPFYLTQLLEDKPLTFAFGQRVLFMCFDNWTVRKMTDHVDFLASCAKLSWQGKSLYKLKSPKGLPRDFHILGRGFYPHDIHSMGNPAISSEVT